MIEKLVLKNFQSHKDTTLEFVEGVNTITGSSDHGKSSVFRALNLICKNKPEGNSFVSHWLLNNKEKLTGNSECILTYNGKKVVRVKGKTNKYYLDDSEYSAFGREVPQPIQDFLNIESTNIQEQSDNFYLLNLPSTQVAEELNKLVNLEIIDESVYNINSKINKLKSDISYTQTRANDFLGSLKFYNDIENRQLLLQKLQNKNNELNYTQKKTMKLVNIIDKVTNIEKTIKSYTKIITYNNNISLLLELINTYQDINHKQAEVISLKNKIRANLQLKQNTTKIISCENKLDSLYNLINLNTFQEKILKLSFIISQIKLLNQNYEKIKSNLINTENTYRKIFPDVCPLCGVSKNEIHIDSR